jgi:hypothetical protein
MTKLVSTSIILALAATAGLAQTVTSVPLEKAPFDTKKALLIDENGGHACPDGYDLYVRAVKPKETKDKDGKPVPAPQGDFDSFYFARQNGNTPAILVSRKNIQEYVGACLQVK